jgi:hypothetical protein
VDCADIPEYSTNSALEKSMWKSLIILLNLTILAACQSASSGSQTLVSAASLSEEYEKSTTKLRSKYDGKEIIVRGYTLTAPTMPLPGNDQGSLLLEESGRDPIRKVTCWFSKEQATKFSQIAGGRYVTVKGVFNGEIGAELKFCRLVNVE